MLESWGEGEGEGCVARCWNHGEGDGEGCVARCWNHGGRGWRGMCS